MPALSDRGAAERYPLASNESSGTITTLLMLLGLGFVLGWSVFLMARRTTPAMLERPEATVPETALPTAAPQEQPVPRQGSDAHHQPRAGRAGKPRSSNPVSLCGTRSGLRLCGVTPNCRMTPPNKRLKLAGAAG